MYHLLQLITFIWASLGARLGLRTAPFYTALGRKIIQHPKLFILVPSTLMFMLAYLEIYEIWEEGLGLERWSGSLVEEWTPYASASSTQVASSIGTNKTNHSINKTINGTHHSVIDTIDKTVTITTASDPMGIERDTLQEGAPLNGTRCKQLWVQAPNVLTPERLSFSLQLLQALLHDIPPAAITLISPFSAWNHSLAALHADPAPLRAINRAPSAGLAGVVRVNSVIQAAGAIHVTVLYHDSDVGALWEANQKRLGPFEDAAVGPRGRAGLLSCLVVAHSPLYGLLLLFPLYLVAAMSNLHAIRSRRGLFGAFMAQVVTVTLAAVSVTRWVLGWLDMAPARPLFAGDRMAPTALLALVLVLTSSENMFRLVAVGSREKGPSAVFVRSMARNAPALSALVAGLVAVLAAGYSLLSFASPHAAVKQYCLFLVVGLVLDHLLHLTFFAAVVSVDIRRVDINAALNGVEPAPRGLAAFLMRSNALGKPARASLRHIAGQYLVRLQPPLVRTWPYALLPLALFGATCTWLYGTPALAVAEALSPMGAPAHRQAVCRHLVGSLNVRGTTLWAEAPVVATFGASDFALANTFRFDLWYYLEFGCLVVFVVAVNTLVLRLKLPAIEDLSPDLSSLEAFSEKHLSGGHSLDILKISTSPGSPFVITIGLDHRVLVWLPIAEPVPAPFGLDHEGLWPVVHVVMGSQGALVALFSKTGMVSCYSRDTKATLWQVELAGLRGAVPLESFFRTKTIPAFLQRKMERESKRVELVELVVVAKNGMLYTISDGAVVPERVAPVGAEALPLISAKRLTSARVSDRLICQAANGTIMVATVVNNKWKTRKLVVVAERYNKGQGLVTPAAISRRSSVALKYQPFQAPGVPLPLGMAVEESATARDGPATIGSGPATTSSESAVVPSLLALVSFVGMIVRTQGLTAELIDAQSGTLLRRFHIGQFVRNSFRVFHSEPQHCRFCGCASVATFSLVYTELDSGTVIMHTFSIENRAKNNICLRVERDPRETRCLGFDSVTEKQHWFEGSECWSLTDMNMIMGIVRKQLPREGLGEESVPASGWRRPALAGAGLSRTAAGRLGAPRPTGRTPAPPLLDTWEGFTMTAMGVVAYHAIPTLLMPNSLLINRITQIERFGHKSIVVGFGNVIKVFYLGNNDELLENDDYEQGGRAEGSARGLSFVNKRRQRGRVESVNFAHTVETS